MKASVIKRPAPETDEVVHWRCLDLHRQVAVRFNMEGRAMQRCSPGLNPMENLSEYRRGNKLRALVRDSYEAILAARKNAWNFLIPDPDRIRATRSAGAAPVAAQPWRGLVAPGFCAGFSSGWNQASGLSLALNGFRIARSARAIGSNGSPST